MTNTPNTSNEEWPTDWHSIDSVTGVQCRQTSMDTYQLKSRTHTVTLNKEGFDLYRNGPDEEFEKWLSVNHIKIEMLDDESES